MKMASLAGRVALVTGVSSGIGAAIASKLVQEGMKVIGCDRRFDDMQILSEQLVAKKCPGYLDPLKCDLRNEEDIKAVFSHIEKNYEGLHVLINNAGLSSVTPLLESNMEKVKMEFDVNTIAPIVTSQFAVKLMEKRKIEDGYIINIGSYLSQHHHLSFHNYHSYTASKHALKIITRGLRSELKDRGSKIRVTQLDTCGVRTEMFTPEVMDFCMNNFGGDLELEAVPDIVVNFLQTPASIHPHEMLVCGGRS